MILYADSSAILSIHLREPSRHDVALDAVRASDAVATSLIGFVEVRSGLARARFLENPARLNDETYERAIEDFTADWRSYFRIRISNRLIRTAGLLAEKHRLRAYDAIHLASAIELQERTPDSVAIATWDRALAFATEIEGLSLAHEVTA